MIIVNEPQDYSQHLPSENYSARIVLANFSWWVRMNEFATHAWLALARRQERFQPRPWAGRSSALPFARWTWLWDASSGLRWVSSSLLPCWNYSRPVIFTTTFPNQRSKYGRRSASRSFYRHSQQCFPLWCGCWCRNWT